MAEAEESHRRKGILCALLAGLSMGGMFFSVRATRELPASELLFSRSVAGVVVLGPIAYRYRHLLAAWESGARWLWLRSGLATVAALCLFLNLQASNVGTANALHMLGVVFLAFGSKMFLRESLSLSESLAVAATIAGTLLLYLPGASHPSAEVTVVGILGACSGCFALVALRQAAVSLPSAVVVWGLCLVSTAAAPLFPSAPWTWPTVNLLPGLAGVTVSFLVSQFFFTMAFRYLKAAHAVSLAMSGLLWGVLLEIALLGEVPTAAEWGCYGLVLAGVVALQNRPKSARPSTESE